MFQLRVRRKVALESTCLLDCRRKKRTMTENFKVPEPKWILDKNGNGHLIWRRDIDNTEKNSRVKFKHDVEIKEFHRKSFELIEPPWVQEIESTGMLTISVTCLVCITVSLVLPWYLLAGNQ